MRVELGRKNILGKQKIVNEGENVGKYWVCSKITNCFDWNANQIYLREINLMPKYILWTKGWLYCCQEDSRKYCWMCIFNSLTHALLLGRVGSDCNLSNHHPLCQHILICRCALVGLLYLWPWDIYVKWLRCQVKVKTVRINVFTKRGAAENTGTKRRLKK